MGPFCRRWRATVEVERRRDSVSRFSIKSYCITPALVRRLLFGYTQRGVRAGLADDFPDGPNGQTGPSSAR